MYAVSEAYKAAIAAPDITSDIVCDIDGTDYGSEYILAGAFSITNQCTDTQDISLGSVYVGQLSATFLIPETAIGRNTWQGRTITPTYKLWTGSDWESLPLGIFVVAEVTHTTQGTKVVAYDYMRNFDRKCTRTSGGYPYDLLTAACTACGMTMATTQAQIEAMPNGARSFNYYQDGDVKTWRDLIYYIGQLLCAFATINRAGELEIRQFSTTAVDSIGTSRREYSASFSDYNTKYTAVTYMEIEAQEEHTYTATVDDGAEINLGSNPLLQSGGAAAACEELVTAVGALAFTPFTAAVAGNPAFDLGDVLTFTGGRAGTTATACIMKYTFTNHRKYQMNGYGANPAIARAASKAKQSASNTTAAIRSLSKRIGDSGKYGVVFLAPTVPDIEDIPKNLDPIDDGEAGEVAYFRFVVTQEKAPVAVHAVVEIDAETTAENDIYGDCLATITVSSDIGVLGTQTEAFGDGLHVLNVDTIKKYFEDGEHDINIELALAGGYAAVNKLKLRTAYLETRARMYKQETLTIYEGFVSGAMELSNCLVTDLNGCVDCGANSQSGINFYSEYFLTGQALAYRTAPNGNLWRINQNFADEKWRSLPISFTIRVGETDVPFVCEQVSGAPIYATVRQDLGEGRQLVIASHYGTGDSQIRRTDTDVVISHGDTVLTAEGLIGTTYYNTSPYDYPGGENAIKEALVASDHIYDVTEADPVQMEGWKTREFALNDFGGLDENERDHLGRYPNRVLLNYKTSEGVSYMYIPIARAVGWQRIIAKVKLYQTVEGSNYNLVGIGAGAVVEGQMVEVLETTDSESWTTISADISDLPYVDYIILYGRDGAQGIRSVWLWKEDGTEEEY